MAEPYQAIQRRKSVAVDVGGGPHPSNPDYPGHVGQGQGPAGYGGSGPSTWGVLGFGILQGTDRIVGRRRGV